MNHLLLYTSSLFSNDFVKETQIILGPIINKNVKVSKNERECACVCVCEIGV